MSGALKGVKKVFKKVGKALKKLWKNPIVRAIVIAVAIYFTAGLAAGAFGAASTGAAAGATVAAEAGAATWVASETGMMVLASEAATSASGAMAAIEAAGGVVQLAGEGALASGVASESLATGLVGGEQVVGNSAGQLFGAETAAGQGLINGNTSPALAPESLSAPDTSLVQEPPVDGGASNTTNAAPNAPSPQSVANTTPQPGNSQSLWQQMQDKWKGFDATEKMLAGKAVSGLAQGAFQGYQASAQQEQAEREKQDAIRRGRVPDATNWSYTPKYSGQLINDNRG